MRCSRPLPAPASAAWRCFVFMRWWSSSAWRWPGISCCRQRERRPPARFLSRPAGARFHRRDFALLAGRRHGRGGAADDPEGHERAPMPRPPSPPTPPPRRWRRWCSWPSVWRWGVAHFRHLASAGPLTEAMLAVLLLAVPGIALLIFLQKKGADLRRADRGALFPAGRGRAFRSATPSRSFTIRPAGWRRRRPCICWPGSARAAAPSSPSAWSAARSALPNAWRWKPCFAPCAASPPSCRPPSGCRKRAMPCWRRCSACPPKWALAVSLLKRAREIVIGVPALALLAGGRKSAQRALAAGARGRRR